MMRATLKRLHSPDVDFDTYWPEDPHNFGFFVQAMIGPEGQDSEESYGITVCTPEWLRSSYSDQDILFGRQFLIVFEYDLQRIKQKIQSYCQSCEGESWMEIVNKLRLIGDWEFEDYHRDAYGK